VAILTLAAAHLLSDNPRTAHIVLLENRDQVLQENYHQTAAFLDSLARYRALTDHQRSQREAGDLLASLLAVREEPFLGSSGRLLIGQGFREIGMLEQMAEVYENALKTARGPVAEEMAYELADYLRSVGKIEPARATFLALADSKDSKWAPRAKLRLAEQALASKAPQDCLRWCQELLDQPGDLPIAVILQVMGRAYEQSGDHRMAANCFSGRAPEPVDRQ
jgi:hypothetical protein